MAGEEETWKEIAYPHFRQSGSSKQAWKYVSNLGRLMAGDCRILEAKPGKGYCRTSLPIQVEGAYAGMAMVFLHRIVAYTFLGAPPTPLHTVDHLNRVREDNRVVNLQWASPEVQLANRECSRYVIKKAADASVYTSVAELSKRLGLSKAVLSALLRQAQPGDEFDIQGSILKVESVSRMPMNVSSSSLASLKKYGGQQRTGRTRKQMALSMYIDGATVDHVGREMHITQNTVLQYIGQASRESQSDVLMQLATRMNLTCVKTRSLLEQDLAAFHQQLQGQPTDRDAYERGYQTIVAKHLPALEEDWKVVKETFRAIHTQLG